MKRKEIVLVLYGKKYPYECFVGGERIEIYRNSTIEKAQKSPYGFYLLIAHAVMARKHIRGQKIRNLILSDKAGKLIDGVFDKAKRGVKNKNWERIGWSGEFFKKHPTGMFFQLNPSFGFMRDVDLDVKDFESQESLSVEEIDSFIDSLLGVADPYVSIKFKVTLPSGRCYKIDNYHYDGVMKTGSTARLTVYSNFPTYFLVFWINTKGKSMKLHPGIEEELTGYKTHFDPKPNIADSNSGERKLIIPSNIELGVPKGKGMGTCIVLCNPRKFDDEISKIRERIDNLLINPSFHRSFQEWSYNESKLEEKERLMKKVQKKRGFISILDANKWEKDVIDQMHGLASQIYFLHIPHNP